MARVGNGLDLGLDSLLGGDQPLRSHYDTNLVSITRFTNLGGGGDVAERAQDMACTTQTVLCWTTEVFCPAQ